MAAHGEKRKRDHERKRDNDQDIWDEWVRYYPRTIPADVCLSVWSSMDGLFPPVRSVATIFGKQHTIPRDQVLAVFSGEGEYSYSGHVVHQIQPTPPLLAMKRAVEKILKDDGINVDFDMVLINRYKDGKDKVGWHADDEKINDDSQPIASVSIGASRDFDVRMNGGTKQQRRWTLGNRDLLVMMPGLQQVAQHTIPGRAKAGVRINLTFRCVKKQ